jgi:hypothetical protein
LTATEIKKDGELSIRYRFTTITPEQMKKDETR